MEQTRKLLLRRWEIAGGQVQEAPPGSWRLILPPTARGYANAQIDDYRALPRAHFPWRPPLTLALRARASTPSPVGTLGFGFWNDPFALSLGQGGAARRLPAAPLAVWFFYGSTPNDMRFHQHSPGYGWRAMALRSPRLPSLLLAVPAATAAALAQIPGVRRPVMRAVMKAVQADEAIVPGRLDEWHDYGLIWQPEQLRFEVDGRTLLLSPLRVSGPLGFVAWVDNQYAVASPERGLRFGVLPTEQEQRLEITELEIQTP